MEEINFAELIKAVEKYTKTSRLAYVDNGQLMPNVANLGGKVGDIAKLQRYGEYYGIAVQLMESLKPLLTDRFVIRLLSMLKKEDYITPLEMLNLTSLDQLQYILDKWFEIAVTDYHGEFKSNVTYPSFDRWIHTVSHDPLLGRIKLVDIGLNQNTGNSVVPADWINREFDSGADLHSAMDKLETRIGRSPVTYAIIYSMIIQKNDSILESTSNVKFDTVFYLELIDSKLKPSMSTSLRTNGKYSYVKYKNTLVGFILDDILEPKGKIEGEHSQSKLREVGLLVSRLQKSIRRGRYGSKALIETIEALNVSPNYNLPEHGFLRVSASKQMVWRLFITILEDCRPYQPVNEPSLLILILLVLITQKVQEYKFTRPVLDAIKSVAILAQFNDTPADLYPWYNLPEAASIKIKPGSDYHNALALAVNNIIMMAGDNQMLRQYYSLEDELKPFAKPTKLVHDKKVYDDIVLSSFDPHSKTYIILYYQACIPISMTTKQISRYIWDTSSSFNVRNIAVRPKPDPILRSIQKYFLSETIIKTDVGHSIVSSKQAVPKFKHIAPSNQVKRTSFLILFGKKYKYNGKEVIIAGSASHPARIKIDNEWGYSDDPKILAAYPYTNAILTDVDPPLGYKWIKNKIATEIIEGKPMINNTYVEYFDGSSVLESITPIVSAKIDKATYTIMLHLLGGLEIEFDTILGFRKRYLKSMVNWGPKRSDIKKIDMDLIKLVYTKIFNQFNNIVMIGPVSRSGHKMQNSINYLLEGKLWAIFNFFTWLYPDTFRPNGAVNFYIRKESAGYIHLINTLEYILFDYTIIAGPIPRINTELWDHQKDSVNKIIGGFKKGVFGFGDASDVGAGKTLTSLKIASELIGSNDTTFSGILVLLPGNKLLKTWEDELTKHTTDFNVIFQSNTTDIGPINRNTIVISTMGRMRDYPINHKWLLLVIDECLTVQNKNALWTEEAWKQSMVSKHLVMMSATFFRTRFDKLYYMLKMLRTGLPERKEYLDTILLESIVSQVSKIKRKWTSNINYFILDDSSRQLYDEIDQSDISLEAKYAKLSSFLISSVRTNTSVSSQLAALINRLEKQKHRCLIYARAADEASLWSKQLSIPIYPTKGNHCIVTFNDGTYGLNDLVIYDTIVMHPPPPDKLPQIKGRLDRPGQKLDHLYIEYFILKDTIEEGLILRMNIASAFLQKYIMPLAKFYDVSVNYKKYLEENKT